MALIPSEAVSLSTKVRMLHSVREALAMEENQMARCLVQTPGFYCTSIPGIGVVLAAHIMAEYGCPDRWPPADNMASYAGIVPRQKQTGGSGSPPKIGHLPLDANRVLKDYLLQAAYHTGTTGEHRLQEHYGRTEHREGRSRLSTAKLLVRILRRKETVDRHSPIHHHNGVTGASAADRPDPSSPSAPRWLQRRTAAAPAPRAPGPDSSGQRAPPGGDPASAGRNLVPTCGSRSADRRPRVPHLEHSYTTARDHLCALLRPLSGRTKTYRTSEVGKVRVVATA